ncbi:MAG: hypothetical protein R2865_16755 [Deinococcales bacterium]
MGESDPGRLLLIAWSCNQNLLSLYLIQAGLGIIMAASPLWGWPLPSLPSGLNKNAVRALLHCDPRRWACQHHFIPLNSYLILTFGWREASGILALILDLSLFLCIWWS